MKANDIWLRCQKARIVSWLNSDRVGATLPIGDGQYVLLAVYENGRYMQPEVVSIPNSPADLGWGPDGPFKMPQQPEEGGDEDNDGS